jgi:hypothetical protein
MMRNPHMPASARRTPSPAPGRPPGGIRTGDSPEAGRSALVASEPESLFDVVWDAPRYRATDPATSAYAAASIEDLPERRRSVYGVLAEYGPLTDEALAEVYGGLADEGLVPPQSPSGLRTRRSELVRSDLVVDSGERGETSTGRAAVVWAVVRIERREEVAS